MHPPAISHRNDFAQATLITSIRHGINCDLGRLPFFQLTEVIFLHVGIDFELIQVRQRGRPNRGRMPDPFRPA